MLLIRGGFRGGVDRGVHPCWPWSTGVHGGAKISITIKRKRPSLQVFNIERRN